MVITRQDLLQLSADDTELLINVYKNPENVLKELKNKNKLDIFNFYDKCRKSYNQKHSKVYINIVKEVEDPKKVLTTLSALITQILLFSQNLTNKDIFLKHSRFQEILDAIMQYSNTNNLTICIQLLNSIKQDLKFLEAL